MKHKRRTLIILILSVLTLIASGLYYISLQQAETLIQSIVQRQSDGKLDLRIKKISLDFSNLVFVVKKAEFRTINTATDTTGYHVNVKELRFNVENLYSVITRGHFIIDTILIEHPQIEVIKYHRKKNTQISLPNEIKTVYEWLESTVSLVNLNHMNIRQAAFTITDRTTQNPKPVTINNINLTINDISGNKDGRKQKFMFARNIIFEIKGQNILFPDGKHGLAFKRFRFETLRHHLMLDSCTIYANETPDNPGSYHIFADSVLIKNLNPNKLATENTLQFDSALCHHPVITMKIKNGGERRDSLVATKVNTDSLLNKFSNLFGKVSIEYLAVKDAKISVSVQKNSKTSVYKSDRSTFSLGGIRIDAANDNPLQVRSVHLNVSKYTGYLPDSLYVMNFDNISIANNKIMLHNFQVKPTPQNTGKIKRNFSIKIFELENVDWMAFLFDQQLKAGYASLIDPYIEIISEADQYKPNKKIDPFKLLGKLKQKVQVSKWYIKNGDIRFVKKSGAEIRLSEAFMNIDVRKLMSAENEIKLVDAVDSLWFSKGSYFDNTQNVALSGGNYSSHKSTLKLNNIDYETHDGSNRLQLTGLKLAGITLYPSGVQIDALDWQRANSVISTVFKLKTNKKQDINSYTCSINKLNGENTNIRFSDRKGNGSFILDRLSTGKLLLKTGHNPAINGLNMTGHNFVYSSKYLNATAENLQFADTKESWLKNIKCNLLTNGKSFDISLPSVNFRIVAGDLLNVQPVVDHISLNSPEIVEPATGNRLSMQEGSILLSKIEATNKQLKINKIDLTAGNPAIRFNDFIVKNTENNGLIAASFKNITISPTEANHIEATAENILLRNIQLEDNSKNKLQITNLEGGNLYLSNRLGSAAEFIQANPDFSIRNTSLQLFDGKNCLRLTNAGYLNSTRLFSTDSLHFAPVADHIAFTQASEWQTTYNNISTGKLTASLRDLTGILQNRQIHLRKINIDGLSYKAYKDKRMPLKHGVVKPLPTELFMNLKADIRVDSLQFRNSKVTYQEYVPFTKSTGEITLENLRGLVTNIRSRNIGQTDSLRLSVSGKIANASSLRVNYRQSYADTLSTFYLKVSMGRMDMKRLNPILRAFTSAELKSGKLDTLQMSAIGRKYIAAGIMRMYYSGLNIQYTGNKNREKSTFIGRTISFFANLLVNSYNITGTNHVYAERNPELGFANYWIKILLSGAMTNAGINTDKHYERKYKQALKTHHVPPIEHIPEEL